MSFIPETTIQTKEAKMKQNDSIGTSTGSDDNNNDDLHATYTTETCIYYYYYNVDNSSNKLDVVTDDSTTTCTQNDNNNDIDTLPILDCIYELDVIVKYATTTIGRHLVIVDDNIDDTGIMLWPATHLLCQYLTMKLSLLNNNSTENSKQQQQYNSHCPSLVPIADCTDDEHNLFILKQFFQYNYPIIHESDAHDVFNDNKGTTSIRSQYEIEEGNDVEHSQEKNEKVQVLKTNEIEKKQKQICRILELGCGCGLVGVVFIKAIIHSIAVPSKCHDSCNTTNDDNDDICCCDYLYVSTDMNCTALDLCYTNYQLNNIIIQSSYNHINEESHTINSGSSCHDEKIIDSSKDIHCHNSATTSKKSDSDSYSYSTKVSTTVWIRQLAWGDNNHIQNLQQNVHDWMLNTINNKCSQNEFSSAPISTSTSTNSVKSKLEVTEEDNPSFSKTLESFDFIFGADIVYPSTNGVVLDLLFQTVDQLLLKGQYCNQHNNNNVDNEGLFILSFCTRDGYKTPIRLLQAATKYNFALVQSISMKHLTVQQQYFTKLPPLLDAQILIFQRQYKNSNITKIINQQSIGHTTTCPIFPGLIQQQQKAIYDANHAKQITVEDLFDELPFVDSEEDEDDKDEI